MPPITAALLALLSLIASGNDSPRAARAPAGPAALSKPPPTREHIAACDSPCHSCIAAARSGNVTSAAKHARACTDAAEKAVCVSAVKAAAPSAALTAGFNGNCSRARAIFVAANAMGAGTKKLARAFNSTRCR
jgi:hypothetical protein